tara:strand:- start:534 stop:761 length:228 start_codon:yes stop_codon:yes gene_type:complete
MLTVGDMLKYLQEDKALREWDRQWAKKTTAERRAYLEAHDRAWETHWEKKSAAEKRDCDYHEEYDNWCHKRSKIK